MASTRIQLADKLKTALEADFVVLSGKSANDLFFAIQAHGCLEAANAGN
ncbi:hypothetical protein [Nitrosomonas communis]|nr:hypothetical protein [Nitrosomonas communis]MCO6426931.1 hypothetical protein [Nitrosomonas communis]